MGLEGEHSTVAPCYDKLATRYEATIHLAAINQSRSTKGADRH